MGPNRKCGRQAADEERDAVVELKKDGYRLLRAARLLACLLALDCAGRPGVDVNSLLAGKPVCVALNWGAGPRPVFHDPLPKQLLLTPRSAGQEYWPPDAKVSGLAEVLDTGEHQALGWSWWLQTDTLWIRTWVPTMDDFFLRLTRPHAGTPAKWWVFNQSDRGGLVRVRSYPCSAPPEPAA